MAKNIEKWISAQKKFRLSDKRIQMARELGLNPDKFGKLNNHEQQRWKAPLPIFIENIYFKHFKRESPETIKPLAQIIADKKKKKQLRKESRVKRTDIKLTNEQGMLKPFPGKGSSPRLG